MRPLRVTLQRTLPCLAAALLAACSGGDTGQAAGGSAAKPAASATAAASAGAPVLAAVVRQSVFSTNPELRDPFFPKKKAAALPRGEQPGGQVRSADLESLLQAGFQGTIGSGAERLGLLNNVILEAGRTVVIPVSAPGQRFEVTARVRQVLPNAVVLDVQNPRQTITVTRSQR